MNKRAFRICTMAKLGGMDTHKAAITFITIVTVFWKTGHLDTRTEIHLLPVRDRHTHALSRNTKH